MPMARQKSADGLSIKLNDDRNYFTPGSEVSGNVTLDTAQDFAIGSVNIEFYGRVKVYYVQSHGQGESHWRGRAPLFSYTNALFEGYHTHKPGSFSWPFTFQIPTHPDIAAIKQSKHQWKEKPPYISTEDYVPAHPMPPTFDFWKLGFGFRWHAFVEYVIKVEVKEADGASMILPSSSRKTTLPIMVKHISAGRSDTHILPLAVQFTLPEQLTEKTALNSSQLGKSQLQSQVITSTVRSSRLLDWNKTATPGHARSSSSSFLEKTKQMLKSNSLPRYSFELSVSVPETIQLLKQDSIPFVVSASPITNSESTTIQSGTFPDVRIDNISLAVTATTYIRCKGPFPPKPCSYDIELLDHHPVDYTITMNGQKNGEGQQSSQDSKDQECLRDMTRPESVDLSRLPGLSTAMIAAKLGRQTEKPLSISFNTYIIVREYKLKWKLELDVVGEKIKVQNDADIPVKVLPPEKEHLDSIMKETDATQAQHNEDEEVNEQSDNSVEGEDGKGEGAISNLTKKRKGRKSKAEEAAEESTVAESSDRPLQYQHGEMLPQYEQPANNFEYRHEIDDTPPRYEKE